MSSLVSETDDTINLLDPYQRNAKNLIWERIMKGDFKLPQQKVYISNEDDLQRIDDYGEFMNHCLFLLMELKYIYYIMVFI